MDAARVSMTTYPLIDRSLDDAVALIAATGCRNIDLLERPPHFSLDASECRTDRVRSTVEAHGVRVANLATYGGKGFAGDDPAEQEREWQALCRSIDVAAWFGARTVRAYRVGSNNEDLDDVPKVAPWYRRAAEYAERKGVYMGVENHGGPVSGTPEVLRDFSRQVGSSHFGVLYDPCNLLLAGVDHKAAFDVFKDHVVHVHLKDGTAEAESHKATMLGEGDVDVPWVLERLDEIGYEGHYTLEYEVETVPPETGLKEWYEYFVSLDH